jgi:hypothetical protein
MSIMESDGKWTNKTHEIVRKLEIDDRINAMLNELVANGATMVEAHVLLNDQISEQCVMIRLRKTRDGAKS